MSHIERDLFQNVDPYKIADSLRTKLHTFKNNKPLLLYIASGDEEDSTSVKYGHISFNSTIRNPLDSTVRTASFLRKYGVSDTGRVRNTDFILQGGVTIIRKTKVHILLDALENTGEGWPENTWLTLSNRGIQVNRANHPNELPPFFRKK